MLGKPRIRLNNLKTGLRLPCLGLNPIIDSINLRLFASQIISDIFFLKLSFSPSPTWVRYPVWQRTFVSPSAFSRRAVVSYWRKYVHEVLVNRLGGLSLPRKSVVRLTDRPDMTLDVYRGRKTTMQCNSPSPRRPKCILMYSGFFRYLIQLAQGVVMKSYRRRCNAMTSHGHQSDVISTSCTCWVEL